MNDLTNNNLKTNLTNYNIPNYSNYYSQSISLDMEKVKMDEDKNFLKQLSRFYIDDEVRLDKAEKLINSINDKEALVLTREIIKEEIRQYLVKTNE